MKWWVPFWGRRASCTLNCAVDLQVYHDGGLMQKIVRTVDGRSIKWYESPRWYSVTRACRAILYLIYSEDRKTAKMLERRIQIANPDYSLLAGLDSLG